MSARSPNQTDFYIGKHIKLQRLARRCGYERFE